MIAHTAESLIAFGERVKAAFLAKQIRSPVHLCDPSQAEILIKTFQDIRPTDYVFCSWRNMYHALLKGIPEEELFQMILDGRSMYIMSAAHRFFSSSIVGGILPIACGVAMGINRKNMNDWKGVWPVPPQVYVFAGDMTATTGLFHEFTRYVIGHHLPVKVIVENNGLSTNTPTGETWGTGRIGSFIAEYSYKRAVPHVGVGEKVIF